MGGGTWVVQVVKRLTFDFGSGHDLMVLEFEPPSGSELTAQSLLGILSLPLSLPLPPFLSLPRMNKLKKTKDLFCVLSGDF